MALMESVALKPGVPMPEFDLKDTAGVLHSREELMGEKGLLVVFTCNHCPYAVAVWPRLVRLAKKAEALGVNTVAVNPNIHPDYPEDGPGPMKEKIEEWGIGFPYLIDDTQATAKSYKAQCTPDPYLLDAQGRLFYHGRIDDNWQDESKVRSRELEAAIEALAGGKPAPAAQPPSMGCSIKWR